MTKNGIPLICDFGISRMTSYTQSFMNTTTDASFKGSLYWAAPEFFKEGVTGVQHSMETDVWAFGMTVYVRVIIA